MKKPSKKPKLLRRESTLFHLYEVSYTPDDLQVIADIMRDLGVEKIEITDFYGDQGDLRCFEHYYETYDEALARFAKESKTYDNLRKQEKIKIDLQKERHKEKIKKEAIELGLIEEN